MRNDPIRWERHSCGLSRASDLFLDEHAPVNMAGLPGIAVPAGISAEGLPLGLQVIGRAFDEETLFSVAHVIEQSAPRIAPPEKWWA